MARLRVNDIGDPSGIVNPITLTSGVTTTATWVSSPGFPTIVAPDYYVIVVEEGATAEEIMYLTAYTSGGTTGTVLRAQEGSSGVTHTTKAWIHGPTVLDHTAAPYIRVAGSNSSVSQRACADYVCTGTSDDVLINLALAAAAGGKCELAAGNYSTASNIILPSTGNTELCGQGKGTVINPTFPLVVKATLTCGLNGTTAITNASDFPSVTNGMLVADVTNPGNIPAGTYVVSGAGTTTITLSNATTGGTTNDSLTFSAKTVWPVIDIYDQSSTGTNPVSGCHVHDLAIVGPTITGAPTVIIAGVTLAGLPGGTRGGGSADVGIFCDGNYNTIENIYTENIGAACTVGAWNRAAAWSTTTTDGVATGALTTSATCTITAGSATVTTSGNFYTMGVFQGMNVRSGQMIPPNTTVLQIVNSTTITLSQVANSNASGSTNILTLDGLSVVASLTQGWVANANIGDAVSIIGAGTYAPSGGSSRLIGYITEVLAPANVASVTLSTTTAVTVASGGFPGFQPGMLVTVASGTGTISANTTVVNINGNTMTLSAVTTTGTATLKATGVLLDTPPSLTTASVTGASTVTTTCGPGTGRAFSCTICNISCKNCWVGVNGGLTEQLHIDGVHGNFIDTLSSTGSGTSPAHGIYMDSSFGADNIDYYLNDVNFYQTSGNRVGQGYALRLGGIVGGRITNISSHNAGGIAAFPAPIRHVAFSSLVGMQCTGYPLEMFGTEQYCNFVNCYFDLDPSVTAPVAVQLGGVNNRFQSIGVTTNFQADSLSQYVVYDYGQWNDYDGVEIIANGGRHNGFFLAGPGGHSIKNINGQHIQTLVGGVSGNIYRTRVTYDPASSTDVNGVPLCAIQTSAPAFPCYTPADDVTIVNITGAGTTTPDPTLTNTYLLNVTTTGAITIANPSSLARSNKIRFIIENNNATTANNPLAITWGTNYGLLTPWLNPAAGQRTVIEFVSGADTPGSGGFVETYRNAVSPNPTIDPSPGIAQGTSLWYPVFTPEVSSTTLALTAGTGYFVPRFIERDCTLTGFAIDVTILGTSPVFHFNVYKDDGTGTDYLPSTPPIGASDATTTPGGTGAIASSAVSIPLTRGWYWMAMAQITGSGCTVEAALGGWGMSLPGTPSTSQLNQSPNSYTGTGYTSTFSGVNSPTARHGATQPTPIMWIQLT